MSVHVAILVSARWLVPAPQRAEWFAEWDAELCYIRATCGSRALTFCLGAYKDALCLRRQYPYRLLDSPLQCLALLAMLAAISLMSMGRAALTPFRDTHGLVELKDISVDQYEANWKKGRLGFTGFAFYRRLSEPVVTPRAMHFYSMIQGTDNLFRVLNVPVASSVHGPVLIVSREIWRLDFDNARQIGGHFLDVGGQRFPVAAVIAADAWPFAGRVDAWLLEDKTLPHSEGLVVGRVAGSGGAPITLPPAARQFREFTGAFVLAMMASLIGMVTTWVKLGVARGVRPRAFLLAKATLLVPTLYCCALLTSSDTSFALFIRIALLPASLFAFRWAVADQRRRCPVCLRLLSTPVLLGKASQIFLGWYGTEQMCAQGHGVLRVPELATSCFASHQWVNLEELCAKVPG